MNSTIKRRDLLEACTLAGCTMQQLETDPTGQLALAYLVEKRAGTTDLDFEGWLDEDLDVEVEVDDGGPDPS